MKFLLPKVAFRRMQTVANIIYFLCYPVEIMRLFYFIISFYENAKKFFKGYPKHLCN